MDKGQGDVYTHQVGEAKDSRTDHDQKVARQALSRLLCATVTHSQVAPTPRTPTRFLTFTTSTQSLGRGDHLIAGGLGL